MPRKECTDDELFGALKTFRSSITNQVAEENRTTNTWHSPPYYDEEALAAVVNWFMAHRHVSDNFLSRDVEKIVIGQMIEFREHHKQSFDDVAKSLKNMLLNSRPEKMNVYMPIYGVSLPAGQTKSLGRFTIMAQDAYDALGIKGWSSEAVNLVKANLPDKNPIVMVSVFACEPLKAREKAIEEFQWLENAMRFFIEPNLGSIGILSYDFSWFEHSVITQSNGLLRGTQSQRKGSPYQLPFELIFHADSIPFKVISELSDPAKVVTEYRKRIRHAVYLGGLAAHETIPSVSFFLGVAALEALFQIDKDKYISASISQQILEAICYLIVDVPKRRAAFEELKTFYGKRSAIVHGGEAEIREQDIISLHTYLKDAIVKLLTDPELAKIQTAQDMSNLLKDMKFGKIQT